MQCRATVTVGREAGTVWVTNAAMPCAAYTRWSRSVATSYWTYDAGIAGQRTRQTTPEGKEQTTNQHYFAASVQSETTGQAVPTAQYKESEGRNLAKSIDRHGASPPSLTSIIMCRLCAAQHCICALCYLRLAPSSLRVATPCAADPPERGMSVPESLCIDSNVNKDHRGAHRHRAVVCLSGNLAHVLSPLKLLWLNSSFQGADLCTPLCASREYPLPSASRSNPSERSNSRDGLRCAVARGMLRRNGPQRQRVHLVRVHVDGYWICEARAVFHDYGAQLQ